MAKPQQPELARSGRSPADPGSAKIAPARGLGGGDDAIAPVPPDNQPGHHPEHEQDKPVEAFVERLREQAAEARTPAAPDDGKAPARARRSTRGGGHNGASSKGRVTAASAPAPRAPDPQPTRAQPTRAQQPPAEVGGHTPPAPRTAGALVPALAALDAVRHPQAAWDEVGESRSGWLVRIALVPFGAWRYDTRVRPRLEAAELALTLAGG